MEHYSAQDKPLFELIEGEGDRATAKPLFSIAEILAGVKEAGKRGIQIKRFKGLGEMNAKELFETTMNPENRKLLRIDMTDLVEAEEMFTKLMGDEVSLAANLLKTTPSTCGTLMSKNPGAGQQNLIYIPCQTKTVPKTQTIRINCRGQPPALRGQRKHPEDQRRG